MKADTINVMQPNGQTSLPKMMKIRQKFDRQNMENIVIIKNTLELYEIEVSETYLEILKGRKDMPLLSEPYPMVFDQEGRLK